jgi:hypothetical protein
VRAACSVDSDSASQLISQPDAWQVNPAPSRSSEQGFACLAAPPVASPSAYQVPAAKARTTSRTAAWHCHEHQGAWPSPSTPPHRHTLRWHGSPSGPRRGPREMREAEAVLLVPLRHWCHEVVDHVRT